MLMLMMMVQSMEGLHVGYYHITPDHSEPSSGALEERLVRKLDRCALTQKQHRWEEEL